MGRNKGTRRFFFLDYSVFLTTFATVGHRYGRRHQPYCRYKKGRHPIATISFSLQEETNHCQTDRYPSPVAKVIQFSE